MYTRSNQLKCDGKVWLKLKYAIQLVGPLDFVSSYAPRERTRQTESLSFSKKDFTSFKCRLALRTLDSDAGDMGNLSNEVQLTLGRARRLALIYAEGSKNAPLQRAYRSTPHRPQAMGQHMLLIRGRGPAWIRLNILHYRLPLLVCSYSAWRDVATHTQSFDQIGVAGGKGRRHGARECRSTPIDRIHTTMAICIGGLFYKSA